MQGSREQRGRGRPRLPCSKPNARSASTPQVRSDDVHAREHTSPAGIGSAAEAGGWPAGGGGRAHQDKLVQTVLSEHADLEFFFLI